MDFISNKEAQNREMLSAIGVKSIDELFQAIPSDLKLKAPQNDDGLSEYEVLSLMECLAAKNTYSQLVSYLGAGAYEHHVPAIVSAITSKSEFLTSYTPYQAEASQGMLQIIFEFQSCICALTGLDVANASLYDGASACGEALLMAMRLNKDRNKVLVASTIHPHYRGVIKQYLESHKTEIIEIPVQANGQLDFDFVKENLDDKTTAVLVQSPNFLGIIEDVKPIASLAKDKGALTVMSADPLSYGLFLSAAELGVDIAVGDCQPFGLSLNFGGPFVGYIACRNELVRQMPGRIIGETVDSERKRGFVLTLQAREQHIRREKATSNICTNQALAALACLIGMLWYGKKGIPKLALTNYQRSQYLKRQLNLPSLGNDRTFNEFAVKFSRPISEVLAYFRKNGIEPGVDLGRFYPQFKDYLLVAVTETKTQEQLDQFAALAKELR